MKSLVNLFIVSLKSLLLIIFTICAQNLLAQSNSGSSKMQLVGTSVNERFEALDKRKKMIGTSPFKGLMWKQVGLRFQGGRIESIIGVEGDPSTMYAGVGAGGVWKTSNAGTTWVPIFDNEDTQAIEDMEINPKNPNQIWVGTGESLLATSSFPGLGIFKSNDGGETWMNMGLNDSYHISRIAINPENTDIVYVAVMGHIRYPTEEKGLFKTTDGGSSWERILYVNDSAGAADIVINPSDHNVLLASMWQHNNGLGSGIYRSTDEGITWEKSEGFPTNKFVGRIGIDISKTNPNVAYAILDNRSVLPTNKKVIDDGKLTTRQVRKMNKSTFLNLDSVRLRDFLRRVLQ